MRDLLKSSRHWLRAGWLVPVVLLALPNCGLPSGDGGTGGTGGEGGGSKPPKTFQGGPEPRSSAVMCDIPKMPDPASNGCATSADIANGMSTGHAAVALNQGESKYVSLDYSSSALAACSGSPKKANFSDKFPDGTTVCLNCGTQIPATYSDGNAACVAMCTDMVAPTPTPEVKAFCAANAHVSTNFDKNVCYTNACSSSGTANTSFVDPRRKQEPVIWVEQNGTNGGSSGNNIQRTAGRSGSFDAGAYSQQSITRGDGWVEFQVSDNTKQYAVGFSGTPANHETLQDFVYALGLNADGTLVVYEGGGFQPAGTVGTYMATDRFRVHVVEKTDGSNTATLSVTKLNGSCTDGTICGETPIATLTGSSPAYPFQVDVSLVDPGAILTNVTMVRIQ